MSRTSTIGPVTLLNLEISTGVGIHVPVATDSPATGFHLFTNKVVIIMSFSISVNCPVKLYVD